MKTFCFQREKAIYTDRPFLLQKLHRFIHRIIFCSLFLFVVVQPVRVHAGEFLLRLEHGRMDALFEGESMQQVMQKISRDTGILTFVDKSLLSHPLQVHFQGLPVEKGLKKIVEGLSYAMIFSAELDETGNHPVKAIRVYPKGQPDTAEYVFFDSYDEQDVEQGASRVMSLDEVEARISRNEEMTRSHVAQKISDRKNHRKGRSVGNAPGENSIVGNVLKRARKVREFKELKGRTLARQKDLEARRARQFQQDRAAMARTAFEQGRETAMKSGSSRDSVN